MRIMKKRHLKDPDLATRYDFDKKKTVHVRLYTNTKNSLKAMGYRMNLTTQDILERLAQAVIDEDTHVIAMLNEYRIMKDNREDLFSQTDKEALFDENDSPFRGEQ